MPITAAPPYRLSVLLVTYNHEKYIRQALDAVFGQVIEGTIELVIADDASSDQTLNIIREYEEKQDRFHFCYLDNSKNLGITKNYQRGFAACTGQYVAVLEGDDYWISPFKLQRQMEFLDSHWESDLCSVNYLVFEEDGLRFSARITSGRDYRPNVARDKAANNEEDRLRFSTASGHNYRLLTARDAVAYNVASNFSTCMYRKTALDALPAKLFEICSYDWIVNICVARRSMTGFLEEPMSVYRVHSSGAWSKYSRIEKLQSQLEIIPAYDALTGHVYSAEFEALSERLKSLIARAKRGSVVTGIFEPRAALPHDPIGYLPPVLLWLLRALMPPRLRRYIRGLLKRGAT